MFEYIKNETILWFDKNPLECGLNFELIGMILGLSIYNNVNLDLQFPIVVYKKLLKMQVTIEVMLINKDLNELEPEMYQNLLKLKNYTDDDLQNMGLNF